MKFNRKSKVGSDISTASMPDIIFMLLIFFMVTTVLREYTGIPEIKLPDAESIEKIEGRRHTSYLWIHPEEGWVFDDKPNITVDDLYKLAYNRRLDDPQLLMSLKFDEKVTMSEITLALSQLRKAQALRVNFATVSKIR